MILCQWGQLNARTQELKVAQASYPPPPRSCSGTSRAAFYNAQGNNVMWKTELGLAECKARTIFLYSFSSPCHLSFIGTTTCCAWGQAKDHMGHQGYPHQCLEDHVGLGIQFRTPNMPDRHFTISALSPQVLGAIFSTEIFINKWLGNT